MRRLGTLALIMLYSAVGAAAQTGTVPEARLKAIYAMTPQQMAETGQWTKSAYDRMLGYVNAIKDKDVRDLVLDMVLRPESKMFKAKATQTFLASPAAGGKGHHYYPGGLPVHVLEWIDVAMAWSDAYEKIYKVKKVDRDMVVAALVLHDWAKVWYEWDPNTGKVVKPAWYPQSWGGEQGKAKWKWMGEHGAVAYAELIHRAAPERVIVATASSHFDPHWDLNKEGEGLNPALAEAAKIAGKPPIVVEPRKQMMEWWFPAYTDGSWSFSHYIAGFTAIEAVDAVAKDLGVTPGSLEANKMSWFVLSRVSDYRIYEEYQTAGFDVNAAKKLILSVLLDSSSYEVK